MIMTTWEIQADLWKVHLLTLVHLLSKYFYYLICTSHCSRNCWSTRNKSKYLFSWSFCSHGGQICNAGLYQHHTPNQYFPKCRIHNTCEIWIHVGGTQTNTLVVLHLYLLLYFIHDIGCLWQFRQWLLPNWI